MGKNPVSARNPFKVMYRGSTHNLSKDGMHRPEGAGNFDNMDDVNIVQSTSLNQGTIQHTPTNNKDLVNKEYVDNKALMEESGIGIQPANTKALYLHQGSASNPSLAYTGAINTGMWFPSTTEIEFVSGGFAKLKFQLSGNKWVSLNFEIQQNNSLQLGSNIRLRYETSGQTTNVPMMDLGTSSRAFIFVSDFGYNQEKGHGTHPDPTVIIHSKNNSTTEWISFTHDQTDGVIAVGTGLLKINTNLDINGGISLQTVAKTGAYTATINDHTILCDGTFNITLPAVSGVSGLILNIKNTGTGTITVDGDASETIDGGLTAVLNNQYESITIQCDGSTWWII